MSLRRNPAYYKWWCYDCEEFVPENEVCLSVHTGPNGCQGDCTPAIEAPPTAKGKHIRTLEAQLALVRELPKQLIRALRVAADALEIASDHNVENVQVWPPEAWNLSAINEDSAEGWCSTYALAVRLREVADELESVLQSAAGSGSNQPEVDEEQNDG